jgi:predicted metalloprotease with PDZ domain
MRSFISTARRAVLLVLLAVYTGPALAQDTLRSAPVSRVHYDVTFNAATARARAVDVAMSFDVGGTEPVLLSLPVWTPGAYQVSNFARNVIDFEARQNGAPVRWDLARHETWRVRPPGAGRVTVSFRYIADSLDTAMSWTREDFLLLNANNVFLYPTGAGFDWPATVRVHTEPGWLVGTAMPATGAPGSFEYGERNYHDLVDHPFFVGTLEVDSAQVAGRWFRLVTYPVGSVSGARRERIWSAIQAMVPPQVAVFGEVPWASYNLMQIADSGFRGASGLEHRDSHVNIVLAQALDHPLLLWLYSHEIVHAWNVKRLRPAEMVPYRYDREQPTPLLWVSEGITDYYADLTLLRGGVIRPEEFVSGAETKVQNVEMLPPISMEDASVRTWVHPRGGTHYSYYDHGSVAGLLLDVLIRDATDNRRSLDHVMRELYDNTYRQGRGFTSDEWWATVDRVGGRSFEEFRRRYVDGRERLPYASTLPLAGIAVAVDSLRRPMIGVITAVDSAGIGVLQVEPGSSAERAGVQVGDRLLAIGSVSVTGEDFGLLFRQRYGSAEPGSPLTLRVLRNGRELSLPTTLQTVTSVTYRLSLERQPNEKARRIRDGLFAGTTN